MPDNSTSRLDDCAALKAGEHDECTEFARFVLLRPRPTPPARGDTTRPPRPARQPSDVARLPAGVVFDGGRATAPLTGYARAALRDLAVRAPVLLEDPSGPRPPAAGTTPSPPSRPVAGAGLVNIGRGGLDVAARRNALVALHADAVRELNVRTGSQPGLTAPSAVTPTVPAPGNTLALSLVARVVDTGRLLRPALDALQQYLRVTTALREAPVWALSLRWRQCWRSEGWQRGRLVRSLPLTPGEQMEVVVTSWDRITQRRTDGTTAASHLHTEQTSNQKWMMAATSHFSNTLNAGVSHNAGLNAGITLPLRTIAATLGGGLGISGTLARELTKGTIEGTEFVHEEVLRTARMIESTRTSRVELAHETGREEARTQVIKNTNRCHTLTYHYFEILERFTVETRFTGAELHLLLPLPVPEITPAWVLCHACDLRPLLPCAELERGLEAARAIETAKHMDAALLLAGLGTHTERPGAGATGGSTSPFAAPVADLLARWEVVVGATLLSSGSGGSDAETLMDGIGEFGQAVAEGLQAVGEGLAEAAAKGQEFVEDLVETASGIVQGGIDTVRDKAKDTIEVVGDFFGGFQFRTAGGSGAMFLSAGGGGGAVPTGGAGTFVWREIAGLASPEICHAMSYLAKAWPDTQALPARDRAAAEVTVLLAFFDILGQPSMAFGKVDALFSGVGATSVGSAGLVGGLVGGTVGGFVGAFGFGVMAIPGAAAGAAIGSASAAAFQAGVLAAAMGVLTMIEAAGFADAVPDDAGLRGGAQQLLAVLHATRANVTPFGFSGAVGGIGGTGGTGSTNGTGEHTHTGGLVADPWSEARTLAEAHVEFDRLACYLRRRETTWLPVIWRSMPDHTVRALLRRHGIPDHVVDARFAGFHGRMGALPVTDRAWLKKEGGLDWAKEVKTLVDAAGDARIESITLPTSGLTVEPLLGQCSACESEPENDT